MERSAADVAFVCAMPMELEPLVEAAALRQSDADFYEGEVGGHAVVATVTGMGPSLATAGVAALLDRVRVGRVLVVGIAGAVEAETPIGTLVRPTVVVDAATGAEYRPAAFGPDPGPAGPAGLLWTVDHLIEDAAEVSALRARGVVALDMETAAVAAVCEARGVPWSVIRALSDRAGDGSVDAEIFALSKPDGTPDDQAVERYFADHPERVEVLALLAEGAVLGARRAAEAAVAAVAQGWS